MNLKNIILFKNEYISIVKNYEGNYRVINIQTREEFEELLEDREIKLNALLIASSDITIALGKELGVATLAYVNPNFPNQTYSGVDMIVEGFDEVDADFLEKVYQRYHHIPWTILETERCVVKELSLEDLDHLFELYADEGMDEFTESLFEYEEEKTYQEAYINNMYRFFGYGMWLVFQKETGKIIGRAGLEHREINDEIELELGYLIGKKYQGQGYATEVCQAILAYAKENTDFEHINCVIQKGNEVSVHMAEKLGFVQREDYDLDGKIMHRYVRILR